MAKARGAERARPGAETMDGDGAGGTPSAQAPFGAIPAWWRDGFRSQTDAGTRTRDELYAEAVKLGVKGRSTMSKAELERAVR